MTSLPSFTSTADAHHTVAELGRVRARTLDLVAHLSIADLERQIDPILSPLAWDLGHIAAYEDLWLVHRHAGEELLHADLAALYDAFETPRAVRGDLAILTYPQSLRYLDDVRERTHAAVDRHGVDPVVHEMVIRHELQHTETMRQAMEVAGLLPPGVGRGTSSSPDEDGDGDGWRHVPGGAFAMGAPAGVFAYDNERPPHEVHVPAFRIARRPLTNASWLRFAEGGGYVRREWWSDEGWAWKQDQDINGDHVSAGGAPDAPVCHLSWFEADALARWQGARLPTEAEWEKAATGSIAGVGQVWEWTSTPFDPYPGFVAHPYREYSEVFFGQGYRVLRGGSWATDPRVATRTFRNWDLPQRHQIFSGVRLAADAGPDVPLPLSES